MHIVFPHLTFSCLCCCLWPSRLRSHFWITMWTKWEIVDKLEEMTTEEGTCIAQPEGNNFVNVSLRLKNVLWLCLQLEMAFLLEKMNYYQQTSKQSAKLHVVFFIIIRFCICYTNIKDRGLLQQKGKNNVSLKSFQNETVLTSWRFSVAENSDLLPFYQVKPNMVALNQLLSQKTHPKYCVLSIWILVCDQLSALLSVTLENVSSAGAAGWSEAQQEGGFGVLVAALLRITEWWPGTFAKTLCDG